MTPDIHLAHALATALAYTSSLTQRHPRHAETVAEVATILGAADETGGVIEGGEVHASDLIIMNQAGIIKAAVAAWTPQASPQLDQACKILEFAAGQDTPGRAPLFVNPTTTEGARFAEALAAALGNLARAAGALSVVLATLEESRFKDFFDVDRLLCIGEAVGALTQEIKPLELPDLSNPEL